MSIISKFKKLGPKIFLKKVLGYEPVFACAIRKNGNCMLYDGELDTPFTLVPISKYSWYADPLLFEYDGRTFLFMESWGYRTRKGVIVCAEIKDNAITKPRTAIEENYHISFPNVFLFNNEIYMIPESEESGGISIYRSIKFPYKWEKVNHIPTKHPLIDCVIESIENDTIYLEASTFSVSNDLETSFWKFKLVYNDKNNFTYFVENDVDNTFKMSLENRNAGRYIALTNNKGKHCVQRSTKSIYGYSLKFYDSKLIKHRWIDEGSKVMEVLPESLKVRNFRKKIIGTHTYSASSKYEVIDISYFRWSPMNWVRQIIKNR